MDERQINKPLSMILDKSFKHLSENECYFILNSDRYLNQDGSLRGTLGKTTPMVANSPACELQMPAGEVYSVGEFYSALTNETYSWSYNSNGVHFIQRINGDGQCQIVYHGCLELNALPKHAIKQWRAYMKVDKLCANVHGKQLIWTFGQGPIYQIDVEASIATNFFTTPFFQRCADPCSLIRMCVPDPCGCLKGEFVPLDPADTGKKNDVVDVGLQFSYRQIYYDNRAGIWADPTTLFFQDAKGCFENTEGFPRCIKLRVPIGNPLVDKIEIAFKKNGVWYLYDTIEKYKKYNNTQQYWYERELSETVIGSNYSDHDCSFDYIFCNDKQCDTIDPKEFDRVYNPIPRDAQGLIPIGLTNQSTAALGVYNYVQGNCPLDKTEVEKFDVQVNCDGNYCANEFATVTVRAVVHNGTHHRNQFIYRLGGSSSTSPDDPGDTAWFGGLNPALDGGFEVGYDQNFNDKIRNFIVYAEGTDSWMEMKQWKAHAYFTQTEPWGVIANMSDVHTRNRWRRAIRNGEFFYQEAKIKVLKGTRGFLRLTSHHATGNDQSKSTFVLGIINDIAGYKGDIGTSDLQAITDFSTEEIYFDTCNGDVVLKKTFLIDDNAVDDGLAKKASAYNGYIIDKNGSPVEGAIISLYGLSRFDVAKTDHNGFYHFYLNPGVNSAVNIDIVVEVSCFSFAGIQTISVQSESGFNTQHNAQITDATWSNGFYANVLIQTTDCDGNPVSGIRVALSGTKYKVSGADGYARFRIRNYETRNRQVNAIVLNNNGCFNIDCSGNCQPCMQLSTSSTPACYYDKPTITLATARMNTDSSVISKSGLKAGGRYPFGFYARGDCGKISAVYPIKYLDIPKTQEKNKDGFCGLNYNGNGITFPDWVKCVDIVRGENLNPFELQWVVDKIERTTDGKIKLTIQSLNDYNEKYLFKTNTIYQWLKGDRVEFIRNGDGKIFSIGQYGLLNYLTLSPFNDEQISGTTDSQADFFNQLLISDDGKLNDLKEGAVIELQRAKECKTEPVYFGICTSIPVVDGKLAYDSGAFSTFDTYYISRTIGTLPSQRFEHHSPSDFWGDRITDAGRAYFVNKYENERRYGRNISINAPNEFNYFGDLVKTFNQVLHGDIIAMNITDDKIGICISEFDNSLFEVASDLLKVGGDGIVRALSSDQVISDPQAKLSGSYGCQYPSIGSIFFGDGYVTWWDVNRHTYVKHDYQIAEPIDEGKCQSYFRRRSQEIETFNRSAANPLDHFRISTGLNYHTGALYVTVKSLRHSGINNEAHAFAQPNDTICFHPIAQDFLGFASFTAEGYGKLDLFDGKGCAFLSYLNGVPYIHPIVADKWNEFFGIACDWIFGIALNKGGDKIKKPLAIEVQSETMFFVKEVLCDKPKFVSEIPPVRWTKTENKWNAAFLGNINSRGGLYGDEGARGYWASVLFCRDNTDNLKYGSVDNSKRTAYSELDLVLMKFMVSEQSGMAENV